MVLTRDTYQILWDQYQPVLLSSFMLISWMNLTQYVNIKELIKIIITSKLSYSVSIVGQCVLHNNCCQQPVAQLSMQS